MTITEASIEGRSGVHDDSEPTELASHFFPRSSVSSSVSIMHPSSKASTRAVGVSAAQSISLTALTIDSFFIIAASMLTGFSYQVIATSKYDGLSIFAASGIIVAAIYATVLHSRGASQPLQTLQPVDLAKDACFAWLVGFALFLFIAFGLKVGSTLSRGAVFSFFFVGAAVVVLSHIRVPFFLARMRQTGAFERRDVILLGRGGDVTVEKLVMELHAGICPNPSLVNFDPFCDPTEWIAERKRIILRVQQLARIKGRGEIVIVASGLAGDRLAGLIRGLNPIPRSIIVVPDNFTAQLLANRSSTIGTSVGIAVQHEPYSATERAIKRAMDVTISATALLFMLPIFLLVGIAIKWETKGPIFFRQVRLGFRGSPFSIWKFRSMSVMENGAHIEQAGKSDPRVTNVGRFLRKTSIDELPQLLNVLAGDMSLIGPRPHARAHDEKYARLIENYELRQHVKPGITGWAQVHGLRGETHTVDLMYRRIEHDLWYAINCSIWLDIQILARTVIEVLRQRNAY